MAKEEQVNDSVVYDIAFSPGDLNDKLPQKALLAGLVLVLMIIHIPFAQSRSEPVYQKDDQGAPEHTVLKLDPVEMKVAQVVVKKDKKRVPMPDPKPQDPEPLIPMGEDVPDVDMAVFDDFTFSEDDFPSAPPKKTVHDGSTAGLEAPVITARVSPNYPPRAARLGMSGYVLLEAILRADGTIDEIRVLRQLGKGRFGFEDEASAALRQWEFLPGRLNGRKVDVRMTLRIDFSMSR